MIRIKFYLVGSVGGLVAESASTEPVCPVMTDLLPDGSGTTGMVLVVQSADLKNDKIRFEIR